MTDQTTRMCPSADAAHRILLALGVPDEGQKAPQGGPNFRQRLVCPWAYKLMRRSLNGPRGHEGQRRAARHNGRLDAGSAAPMLTPCPSGIVMREALDLISAMGIGADRRDRRVSKSMSC